MGDIFKMYDIDSDTMTIKVAKSTPARPDRIWIEFGSFRVLTREQAAELAEVLQRFVDTGRLTEE